MAISTNPLLAGMSGKFGSFSIRQRGGKTIVCHRRSSNGKKREATMSQIEGRKKFIRSTLIAKKLLQDPEMVELYTKAAGKRQSAYTRAVSDAMQPPYVNNIDVSAYNGRSGDSIIIEAKDDLKVAHVKVSVFSPEGTLIEEGAAVKHNDWRLDWQYITSVTNPSLKGCVVKATAYDLPGNEGVLEIKL